MAFPNQSSQVCLATRPGRDTQQNAKRLSFGAQMHQFWVKVAAAFWGGADSARTWLVWVGLGSQRETVDQVLQHLAVCWHLPWRIEAFQGFFGGAKWILSIHRICSFNLRGVSESQSLANHRHPNLVPWAVGRGLLVAKLKIQKFSLEVALMSPGPTNNRARAPCCWICSLVTPNVLPVEKRGICMI